MLPKLGEEGEITHLDIAQNPSILDIEAKLRTALSEMLKESTPFLATGGDSDYDGISRYDEWAG